MSKKEEGVIGEEFDKILSEQESEADPAQAQDMTEEQTAPEETAKDDAAVLTEQLKEAEEKYLRLYADFENFRKRSLKEKADAMIYACSPLMEKLIGVVDNFERALGDKGDDSPLCEGMKMVHKQLTDILAQEGLSEIKSTGEQFDPNKHNAVMVENNADIPDEQITKELQKGYVFKDKVVRPSMVAVNKHE